MQLSLSWRLTAPARTLVTYFLPPNASPSAPFEHVPTNHHLGLDTFAFDDQISSAVFPPDAYNIMQSTVSSVMPEDIKVGSTTHDFMAYSDQEFLRSAYQLVLGRHPDAGGSLHFHSQMASGISRLHILAQLRLSPEGKARSTTFPELDGVLATATNAKACATSFADLLAFQGSTFIRAVYVTLLGREPDDGGMENWLGQMREGATKLEVLALLQESTEAQSWAARLVDISHAVGQYQSTQKMSPDPDGESSAPRTAPPMTQSIEELLTLPAPEFVLAAFWILLGRSPDPEAFGAYLAHLDAGVLRLRLLADIHASGEAAARRSFLSQIASQTGRSRLAATPVIGLLAQRSAASAITRGVRPIKFQPPGCSTGYTPVCLPANPTLPAGVRTRGKSSLATPQSASGSHPR